MKCLKKLSRALSPILLAIYPMRLKSKFMSLKRLWIRCVGLCSNLLQFGNNVHQWISRFEIWKIDSHCDGSHWVDSRKSFENETGHVCTIFKDSLGNLSKRIYKNCTKVQLSWTIGVILVNFTSETVFKAIVYNGLVVYGPALAMSQCAGMDLNVSILVVGLTCLFYTVIGGMKAVIWTDVWQTLWMIRKEYISPHQIRRDQTITLSYMTEVKWNWKVLCTI